MRHPSSYVFLAHFADDLYEGQVCCLCLPIPLRVIGRRMMVLDLVELQHLPHITIDKRYTIVTDNPMGYSKPDNYVLINEVCYYSSRGLMEW